MIIGTLMALETCLILGQVSHNLLYKAPNGHLSSGGEIDEETTYIQVRSSMARTLEINGKKRQVEGEAYVV